MKKVTLIICLVLALGLAGRVHSGEVPPPFSKVVEFCQNVQPDEDGDRHITMKTDELVFRIGIYPSLGNAIAIAMNNGAEAITIRYYPDGTCLMVILMSGLVMPEPVSKEDGQAAAFAIFREMVSRDLIPPPLTRDAEENKV